MLIPQLLSSLSNRLKKPVLNSPYRAFLASVVARHIRRRIELAQNPAQIPDVIRPSTGLPSLQDGLKCNSFSKIPCEKQSQFQAARGLLTKQLAEEFEIFNLRDLRVALRAQVTDASRTPGAGKARLETSIPHLTVVQRENSKDDFI